MAAVYKNGKLYSLRALTYGDVLEPTRLPLHLYCILFLQCLVATSTRNNQVKQALKDSLSCDVNNKII